MFSLVEEGSIEGGREVNEVASDRPESVYESNRIEVRIETNTNVSF